MSRTKRIDRLEDNLVIGGSFEQWQRGTSFTGADVNFDYTADRWQYQEVAAVGAVTVNRIEDAPNNNSQFCYEIKATTGYGSKGGWGASDLSRVRTILEGNLTYGLDNGGLFTVGFWMKAKKVGKMTITLLGLDSSGSADYVYSTQVEILVADVWEFKTIKPSNYPGILNKSNGRGLEINFSFASGTNFFPSSLDTWNSYSSAVMSSIDDANWLESTNDYVRIAQVQLIKGDLKLDGSNFSIAGGSVLEELKLCQRYYEKMPGPFGLVGDTSTGTTTNSNATWIFKTVKRSIPIVSFDGNVANWRVYGPGLSGVSALVGAASSTHAATIDVTCTGRVAFDVQTVKAINTGAFIAADSEL